MIQISSTATLFTFNSQVPWGMPAHQLLEWPICEALMEPTSLLLMQEMEVEMPQCATGKAEGEAGDNSHTASAFKSLGWLDRLLALWVLLAMAVGIILGNFVPSVGPALQRGKFVGVSIPIGESVCLLT